MSLESVRAFLATRAPDIAIVELDGSTATVALAAAGHGVAPAQIAKTLSLRVRERNLLLVTSGDARLDNKKAKAAFGGKPRLLTPEEVMAPPAIRSAASLRSALRRLCRSIATSRSRPSTKWCPAAGSSRSALRINPLRMAELVEAEWVDVCGSAR
jgi:prolyl-tRNA editing enzyme YbaK/EbsC (Cys-tRNA(Pro) deacylase)